MAPTELVPRVYQLELLEMAKKRNVVAYLETGTGKTLVAALLLRHALEKRTQSTLPSPTSLQQQQQQPQQPELNSPKPPSTTTSEEDSSNILQDLLCDYGSASDSEADCDAEVILNTNIQVDVDTTTSAVETSNACAVEGGSPFEDKADPAALPGAVSPTAAEVKRPPTTDNVNTEAADKPIKFAVFLAPQVALVKQQSTFLQTQLPPNTSIMTYAGAGGSFESFDIPRWRSELSSADVVVMTPQILVNLLDHGIARIGMIDLLVFDEAHHCSKNHPYNQIMKHYHSAPEGVDRPHIFGMTAAPAHASRTSPHATILKNIIQLERNLDCRVVTVSERMPVMEVAPIPELCVERFVLPTWPVVMKEFVDKVERIRVRMHLALNLARLQWEAEVKSNFTTIAPIGIAPLNLPSSTIELNLPAFRGTHMHRFLSNLDHVLHNLGPYCAAVCAVHSLKWLDEVGWEESGGIGGVVQKRVGEMGSAVQFLDPGKMKGIEQEAALHDIPWSEIEDCCHTASLTIQDLLQAFLFLFFHNTPMPAPALTALAAVKTSIQGRKSLGSDPVLVMQEVLGSVTGSDLEASLETAYHANTAVSRHIQPNGSCGIDSGDEDPVVDLSSSEAKGSSSTKGFPLVTPKTALLVRHLLKHKASARALPPAGTDKDDLSTVAGGGSGSGVSQWSGIVFVQQQVTARALHALLEALPCAADLRTSALMAQGNSLDGKAFNPKMQESILAQFRQGTLDVLISTSVAEEGIDVKTCCFVARFDLPHTPQSFLQSRGRARMKDSHLLMMLEHDNVDHEQILESMVTYEEHLRQQALANNTRVKSGIDSQPFLSTNPAAMPAVPIPACAAGGLSSCRRQDQDPEIAKSSTKKTPASLEGGSTLDVTNLGFFSSIQELGDSDNDDVDIIEDTHVPSLPAADDDGNTAVLPVVHVDAEELDSYVVQSTGAKGSLANALAVLQHYVSKLPADRYTDLRPMYWIEKSIASSSLAHMPTFLAQVVLPGAAAVRGAQGRRHCRGQLAKASAALAAIRSLHAVGALDDHLLPYITPKNPPQIQNPPKSKKQKTVVNKEVKEKRKEEIIVPEINNIVLESHPPLVLSGDISSMLSPAASNEDQLTSQDVAPSPKTLTFHCYQFKGEALLEPMEDCRNSQLQGLTALILLIPQDLEMTQDTASFLLRYGPVRSLVPADSTDPPAPAGTTPDAAAGTPQVNPEEAAVNADKEENEILYPPTKRQKHTTSCGGSSLAAPLPPATQAPTMADLNPEPAAAANEDQAEPGLETEPVEVPRMVSKITYLGTTVPVQLHYLGTTTMSTSQMPVLLQCSQALRAHASHRTITDTGFLLLPIQPFATSNADSETNTQEMGASANPKERTASAEQQQSIVGPAGRMILNFDWDVVKEVANLATEAAAGKTLLDIVADIGEGDINQMEGKVVITRYNKVKYEAREVIKSMNLLSTLIMPVKKRPRDEEQQPNEDGTPVADDEEDAEASPDDEPDMLVNCTVYQFQDNLDVDQVMQVQEMVEQMVAEVEKEACIAAASPAGGAAPETLSCFKGYIEVPHKDNEVHHSDMAIDLIPDPNPITSSPLFEQQSHQDLPSTDLSPTSTTTPKHHPPSDPEPDPEPEFITTTYQEYYKDRWGYGELKETQPLLLATRISTAVLQGRKPIPPPALPTVTDVAITGDEGEKEGADGDGTGEGLELQGNTAQQAQHIHPPSSETNQDLATSPAAPLNTNNSSTSAAAYPVHLVPELCSIHPIPVPLWPGLAAVHHLMWQLEGVLMAQQVMKLDLPTCFTPCSDQEYVENLDTRDFADGDDRNNNCTTERDEEIPAAGGGALEKTENQSQAPMDEDPSTLRRKRKIDSWMNEPRTIQNGATELELEQPALWKQPPVSLIRAAITARSAQDAAGDFESLETVGDSFLKYATSAELYLENKHYHEGQLHRLRIRKVSNAALLQVALRLDLQTKIRAAPISNKGGLRTFLGLGTLGGEQQQQQEQQQRLSFGSSKARNSKVLADCVEALVGAFLVGSGERAALSLLRHFKILSTSIHDFLAFSKTVPRSVQTNTCPSIARIEGSTGAAGNASVVQTGSVNVAAIETILQYKFNDPALIEEALTHGSCLGGRSHSYQRLEFLGDAVLDNCLTLHLYSTFLNCTPAQMNDVRCALVNAERLALAATQHGLGPHIKLQSPALLALVQQHAVCCGKKVQELMGERGTGVEEAWKEICRKFAFGLDTMETPKVLSDIVEALIGAVWVDSRGDTDACKAVVLRLLGPLNDDINAATIHPVRKLRELTDRQKLNIKMVTQDQPGSNKVMVQVWKDEDLLVEGSPAVNAATAERLAASRALEVLLEAGQEERMEEKRHDVEYNEEEV